MEPIPIDILGLKEAIISLKPAGPGVDYVTMFGVAITAIGVIAGIIKLLFDAANQKKVFLEGQNQRERSNITHVLNHFFSPLKELRAESKTMYDRFALNEKSSYLKQYGKRWRALRHLSQGNDFSKQDKKILYEIIKVGKKQLKLMENQGYIIDNSHLADLLGKLGAHIRLLALAADHKLDGKFDELEPIVFPREVDGALESEIRKLQDRYKMLLDPTKKDKTTAKLTKELADSISDYDQKPHTYFRETAYIDLKEICNKFLEYVPFGGIILDAGCGVGRDTRFFIKKGYRVISFDASTEMVKMCNNYPFAYCLKRSFSEIDYIEEFDGIWANASLIHLSRGDFAIAMHKLIDAAKPGGAVYFSLKVGEGKTKNQSKTTYYHENDYIQKLVTEEMMLERIMIWESKGKKKTDNTYWRNFLYKKPKMAE